ncbi:MAG: hypothetical protein D6689_17110 [Deltaproteobacteria bacterium]|nr:MAG: hypothetical protein D6689_17110 [Deltaproteobacteria bacterium]
MGFYPQPNDWTCGPFALKHALVTLGRLCDEDQIASIAHPHWWSGTDEVRLAKAAREFDCDLPAIRRRDPDLARGALVRYLRDRIPVLLCVDDWGHWITVVNHESNRFVVLDSNHDPVLNVVEWPRLRNRWCYLDWEYDEDNPPALYDLHPVRPRFRVPVTAQFSVQRAQFLRRPENESLALHWDEYLEDLLEICAPPSSRFLGSMTMGEFLRRHQELLMSRVTYWHGDVERDQVARLLRNFRFVAETYGLVIPASATRRALTDMAMLVAFWVASAAGIGDLYGSQNARSRCRRRRRRARSRW